jgi:hypothetical protein
MPSLEIFSGSHSLRLAGSLLFFGDLINLSGNGDNGAFKVRGFGTIQEPIWELISPLPK